MGRKKKLASPWVMTRNICSLRTTYSRQGMRRNRSESVSVCVCGFEGVKVSLNEYYVILHCMGRCSENFVPIFYSVICFCLLDLRIIQSKKEDWFKM